VAVLDGLLHAIARDPGSRLRLAPGETPTASIAGREIPFSSARLDGASILNLLTEVAPGGAKGGHAQASPWCFAYTFDGVEFDISAERTALGWTVSARPVAAAGPSVAECEPAASKLAAAAEKGVGDEAPRNIDQLLEVVTARGASDLHLIAGQVPRIRIDGALRPFGGLPIVSAREVEGLLSGIMNERNRSEFDETNDTDFALERRQARFRVNVFRDRHGPGAVFRRIPLEIPSFDDLKLPESLRALCQLSKGLVLVTGPTGSGKSTTLAAMIDFINHTRDEHIITIEDPVEFVHPSDRCLINQREVGVHTTSFKRALRAALREDPDVVLVGEMRDLETVSMAIETAATGHLVFGTLHTTTAPSTVERIIGQFPGELQEQTRMMLSDSLRGVVAQTLLKRIGGGRVAAFEILLGTPAVCNIIREGKTHQLPSAIQTGRDLGMTTLTDSLFNLVRERLIEPDEALRKATDKDTLAAKLAAAGIRGTSRQQVGTVAAEAAREEPLRALA